MNIQDHQAIAGILRKEHQQSALLVQPGHGHAINAVNHLVEALADYLAADASKCRRCADVTLETDPEGAMYCPGCRYIHEGFDRAAWNAACYGETGNVFDDLKTMRKAREA